MPMNTVLQHYLVPQHLVGMQKDLSYVITLESGEDADDWFVESMERLLKLNDWNRRASDIDLLFNLTDHHGKNVNRRAHAGDYIKLHASHSDDFTADEVHWMKIAAIEYDDYPDDDKETIAMHIIPSAGPNHNNYYRPDTTDTSSTFVVERCGKRITGSYHSRNEIAETDGDNSHDILSAIVSWYSITDKHWDTLLKAMIE
jgi:hypothetical protein